MCHRSRCCWGVDKVFSTNTSDNNENEKEEKPGTVLVPGKDQKMLRLILMCMKCSPAENPEPTERHLPIEEIKNRSNIGNFVY